MAEGHRAVHTVDAPHNAGIHSQGLVTRPDEMMFVSGQVGRTANGVLAEGIGAQADQAFANVKAVLAAGGFAMSDVAKVTVYMADLADAETFNEIYREQFSEPMPCRSRVGVQMRGGILVEIEVVAVKNRAS